MYELIAMALAVTLAAAEPQPAAHPRAAPPVSAAARVLPPGEDKFRHFAASYGATAFAFGAVRALDRDAAMPAAVAAAAALGIAKELHDRRRGGRFDFADLAANAAGITAAYFFLRELR